MSPPKPETALCQRIGLLSGRFFRPDSSQAGQNRADLASRQRFPRVQVQNLVHQPALFVARRRVPKLWELRAAAGLARLRRDQGRQPEARDLLAPVNGWFAEGFETPDLKEVEVLLAELE